MQSISEVAPITMKEGSGSNIMLLWSFIYILLPVYMTTIHVKIHTLLFSSGMKCRL